MNKLLGRGKNGSPHINVGDGLNVATEFSKYLANAIPVTGVLPPPTFQELDCSFQFQMIPEEDVLVLLSRLQGTKASGVDDIRANVLKLTAPAIAKVLFNLSLQTSQIPVEWKAARITPIPKAKAGGSGSNFTEFRPISVLSISYICMDFRVCPCSGFRTT